MMDDQLAKCIFLYIHLLLKFTHPLLASGRMENNIKILHFLQADN